MADSSVTKVRELAAALSSEAANVIVRKHVSNELFFAVVGHAGSGTSDIAKTLKKALENPSMDDGPFTTEILKASDVIAEWAAAKGNPVSLVPGKMISNASGLQDAGDKMRINNHAAVAQGLVAKIRVKRGELQKSPTNKGESVVPDGKRRAYILDSIRHPAEVHLLRSVYHSAFSLIGIVCEEEVRIQRIMNKYADAGRDKAKKFMERDKHAEEKHGQHVSDAFHLADIFLDNTQERYKNGLPNELWTIPEQLSRFIAIITHQEIVRPTIDESAMHAAHGAKLRSSCLSRQVGAAVVDTKGTVISTGTNEVPCAKGGVYRNLNNEEPGFDDGRCAFRNGDKYCSNTREHNEIINDIVNCVSTIAEAGSREELVKKLKKTRIASLIEFSRAVHAEMDALLSAARLGTSIVGTRVFVTTFPCHYCARHLVSAGVDEVQFIEPYPKSQALKLHNDSITMDLEGWQAPSNSGTMVLFRPYTGVAPRMYERAFLKDRPLKDDNSGDFNIGNPEWGNAWDIAKVSYPELELRLSKQYEKDNDDDASA